MSDIAIRVEGLSKRYRIGGKAEPYFTLRDSLLQFGGSIVALFSRNGRKDREGTLFWALKDVSFEVNRGEVVGIIGRNGAGKTTLLKILSRITEPTEGRAEIEGRVASLLEVGTGFHPELTGRENIFLSGAILGMRKAEIGRKFDEIVAFAEVEKFIDTPVKRFSSGMYLRLAFAVAAHLNPEILLVDEVLAVGDANFQKKCLGKMGEVVQQGRIVLFVSHNMGAVQRLCSRGIHLENGRVMREGSVQEVIAGYLGGGQGGVAERVWGDPAQMPGNEVVRLRAVRARNERGEVSDEFAIQEPVHLEMEYEVLVPGYILEPNVFVYNEQGVLVFVSKGYHGNEWAERVRPSGKYQDICYVPGNFLTDGQFSILVGLTTPPWTVHLIVEGAVSFRVVDDFMGGARGSYPREWPGGVVRPLLIWKSTYVHCEEEPGLRDVP